MKNKEIENKVLATQKKWADCVLNIGEAFRQEVNLDNLIHELLHEIYAFDFGNVLFKPTLAKKQQFRSTKEEFLSYFLGQNKKCGEDLGFAIKNWKSIDFENYKIIEHNNYWLSMGNYYFKDGSEKILKVEYTFGFIKTSDGQLKINLHHSSLPYDG